MTSAADHSAPPHATPTSHDERMERTTMEPTTPQPTLSPRPDDSRPLATNTGGSATPKNDSRAATLQFRRAATLQFRRIVKSFPDGQTQRTVLKGVDLDIHEGEMVAIMGPSGSGKSTLLHLAAGLDLPDSGRILLADHDVTSADATALATLRRQILGYVEQRLNLISSLTALENTMLPLELDGMRRSEARRAALESLEQVGMADRADETADRLSGGEQQRVAIARALVGKRRVLLVDEPTAALDSLTGESIMKLLRQCCDDRGVAALVATHDATHAAWADRVVHIHDGVVQ